MAKKKTPEKKTLVQRFAENMQASRRAVGLSQEALAQKAGISVSYVSMLERAQRTPPLDTVEAICTALGRDPVVLFA